MLPEDVEKQEAKQPQIVVGYGSGRWGNVFHIFDLDKREIALRQKDAVALAKRILKIAKEG